MGTTLKSIRVNQEVIFIFGTGDRQRRGGIILRVRSRGDLVGTSGLARVKPTALIGAFLQGRLVGTTVSELSLAVRALVVPTVASS